MLDPIPRLLKVATRLAFGIGCSGLINLSLFIALSPSFLASTIKGTWTVFDLVVYVLYGGVVLVLERILCSLPALTLAKINTLFGVGTQAVLSALVSTLLVANQQVQSRLGIQLIQANILAEIEQRGFADAYADKMWIFLIALFLAALIVHGGTCVVFFNFFKKRKPKLWRKRVRSFVARLLIYASVSAAFLSFLNQWADPDSLKWNSLPFGPLLADAHQPKLLVKSSRKHPQISLNFKRKPEIVIILAESLRADMIAQETMPNVWAFVKKHHCTQSAHHFSGGHTTMYGVFSLFNSIFADNYHSFAAEAISSLPLEIFRKNGYHLRGLSNSGLDKVFPPFRLFDFDQYDEVNHGDPTVNDARVAAIGQSELSSIQAYSARLSFFFLFSTHSDYFFPEKFEKFQPFEQSLSAQTFWFKLSEAQRRKATWNSYRNSALYVDDLINTLLQPLASRVESGESIVIIVGDHGEEFWEHGLQGHLGVSFVRERIETAMALCLPPGALPEQLAQSHHVDILPTILDWLSGDSSSLNPFLDGVSLLKKVESRTLAVTSVGFPETSDQIALITGKHKRLVHAQPFLQKFTTGQVTDLADQELVDKALDKTNLSQFFLRFLQPAQ